MQRTCDVCATVYEAKRPASRYCSPTCRKRASRAGVAEPVIALPPAPLVDGAISAAVLVELTAADRVDTVAGQRALHLARLLEAPTAESGSAKAALDKQLATAMEQALDGASRVADPLDELLARRARRGA